MKNKYYTPEIEEFHDGFRYEYKSDEHLPMLESTNGEWEKRVYYGGCGMDGESEHDDVYNLIESDDVRVKYLDREDIEELGWEYNRIVLNGTTETFRHPNENNRELQWKIGYRSICIGQGYGEFVGECYEIKNYNEMERLMRQINIK